jgi:hypothetical protein
MLILAELGQPGSINGDDQICNLTYGLESFLVKPEIIND